MAAGFLSPDPRLRELSDLGVVLPGALLHTYVSGTPNTPLQTTSDAAGLVPNLNPLVASAGGLFGPIYLQSGVAYKFVLTDASGGPIWEQDPVGLGGVAQGGTGLTAGISGGIPYFSSISAMASSALLAAHGIVLGGGAGAAPLTIGAGTAGQALRSGGASADPAFGDIIQTTTLTGTQNDVALTAGCTILRCNNASLLTITGFAAGYDGQRVVVASIGAGQIDLLPQSGLSVAASRLIPFASVGVTSLAAGSGVAEFVYDATTARWRMTSHDQGAWISPAFAAGNFTGNAAMTWTVIAGNVTMFRYILRGRTVFVAFAFTGTTVAGTPNTSLLLSVNAFGAFQPTSTGFIQRVANTSDNGATVEGLVVVASGTAIAFTKRDGTNWAAGTNAQTGLFTVEVT